MQDLKDLVSRLELRLKTKIRFKRIGECGVKMIVNGVERKRTYVVSDFNNNLHRYPGVSHSSGGKDRFGVTQFKYDGVI